MLTIGTVILPQSYFDGLSSLWGGCAYVGSAIVAGSLTFHVVSIRPDAWSFIRLLLKVFIIALATLFIREWLMRLNDIVYAFGTFMGVQPDTVDDQYVEFLKGKSQSGGNVSVWDVIWGTKSIGTAFAYAMLWLFGWMSWGIQYIIKLIGGILLTAGWSLSPIFLAFFILRPMAGVARKYTIGLVALVCWPFGWVIAAVVTKALLQTAAMASLIPVPVTGGAAAPMLTVLLVGIWMILSSILAPWVTMKVFLMGANPAAAFAGGVGGAAQAALAGGTGAAVVAVTGGGAAPLVIASAAAGALSSGTESAMRGGGSARTTGTVIGGFAGMNTGRFIRQNAESSREAAMAQMRRSAAATSMAQSYAENVRRQRSSRSGFDYQPHDDDPNRSANEIDSHDSDNNKR